MAGGDRVFGNHLGEDDLRAVFDNAMKEGLGVWDTATVYGMGASEEILGSFIRNVHREDVYVSTKFTPQIAPECENPVVRMAEESCRRLHTDYIDLFWIHNPADVEKWTPMLVPLLESGLVKGVGVSNHNLEQIKRADEILGSQGFGVSAVQNHFSLLYRSSEDAGILDYCHKTGKDFYAYMVLEQGALSGRYGVANPMPEGSARAMTYNAQLPELEQLLAKMKEIGGKHGVGVSQIGVAYALSKGTTPIVGVTKPHHVTEAVQATAVRLAEEEIRELELLAKATGVDTKGSWENPMV